MTPTVMVDIPRNRDLPSPEAIDRQRREQDAEVMALRRLLAQSPIREELVLYSAA